MPKCFPDLYPNGIASMNRTRTIATVEELCMRSCFLSRATRGFLAACFTLAALSAQADDQPQVIATGQGIAVAISNWTNYVMQQPSEASYDQNAGLAGPGFPFALWPLQHTGTSIVMRGGPASEGQVAASYVLQNDAETQPGFIIGFEANTEWNFEAAASLLLHTAKKTAAKQTKNAAKEATKDTAEAAGAADGMTEVIAVYKVIKLIAKLFGALDPTFVMNIQLAPTYGTAFVDNSCVTKYQSTPGPANVQIFGPDEAITQDNVDSFFVVSAGSSNGIAPGFVDLGVNSLCDYACAAWDGSLELLTNMDQATCLDVLDGTDPQASDYDAAYEQNICLSDINSGEANLAWIAPDWENSYPVFSPDTQCESPAFIDLPQLWIGDTLCGECTLTETEAPQGTWSESCNQVSYVVTPYGSSTQQTLTADCAADGSTERTIQSAATCSTNHWSNNNGQLECAYPPGSWSEECDFNLYSEGSLCAVCEGSDEVTCATCPSGSWYNFEGHLMCDEDTSTSHVVPPPEEGLWGSLAVRPLWMGGLNG